MGSLHYGPNQVFHFEDRTLAHLRAVMLSKFVLRESFAFTWNDAGAQYTVWMHPGLALHFEFGSSDLQDINRAWLEALTSHANSPRGLRLIPEPGTTGTAGGTAGTGSAGSSTDATPPK